ncbi:hypothetical protein E3N88_02825 [Mikania micrantha]|uniref:Uncharacterized protein n=1 Tax=Mikania micrantha TaxID=192012 RepID=A0A5N6Q511_9ASTR|nr:hypothetical protein E3N88_02825 [Mikania micrantha]
MGCFALLFFIEHWKLNNNQRSPEVSSRLKKLHTSPPPFKDQLRDNCLSLIVFQREKSIVVIVVLQLVVDEAPTVQQMCGGRLERAAVFDLPNIPTHSMCIQADDKKKRKLLLI